MDVFSNTHPPKILGRARITLELQLLLRRMGAAFKAYNPLTLLTLSIQCGHVAGIPLPELTRCL